MKRNKNNVINIPCDGLEKAIISSTDASILQYRKNIESYISEFLQDTPCGRQ